MKTFIKTTLVLVCLAIFSGCSAVPVSPTTQPSTQPSTVVQQEQALWNAANTGYVFSSAILNDLHLQGTISDADWSASYAPALADTQILLDAWQTQIGQPGSIQAQAKFAAAGVNVALLVIQSQTPHKSPTTKPVKK